MRSYYKVLNILETSRIGGPQTRVISIHRSLPLKSSNEVLIPSSDSKNFIDKCNKVGIIVRSINIKSISGLGRNLPSFLVFALRFIPDILSIYMAIQASRCTIVHVNGILQVRSIIAAILSRKKLIWHLNDTSSGLLVQQLVKLLCHFADATIYASRASYDYYSKIYMPSNYYIVPAPVDTEFYDTTCTDISYSSELIKISSQFRFLFGSVLNVSPVKNIELSLKLLSHLPCPREDFAFVTLGTVYDNQTNYMNYLQKLALDLGITFIHFDANRYISHIRHFYKILSIYLCTSHSESSPLSVWQAMSMSIPIAACPVGDIPLHITNKSGIIITPHDLKTLQIIFECT